jgi:hypothetical protein
MAKPGNYTITMTSPTAGMQFESCIPEINFIAEVSAPDDVIQDVKFYRNGSYFGKDRNNAAPFEVEWKRPHDGIFEIHAELTDTSDVIYTSEKITIRVGEAIPGNLVYNGEFNCDRTSPWSTASWSGAITNFVLDSTFALSTPPALFVDIVEPAPDPQTWTIQIYQPIAVDSGTTYDISFKAEVSEEKNIHIGVQTNDGSRTILWEQLTIGEETDYSYVFEADQTLHADAKFLLALGGDAMPIAIDDVRFVSRSATGVTAQRMFDDDHEMRYLLTKNYPKPFNPTTTIQFDISNDAHVTVEVFNVHGQKVKIVAQNDFAPGQHSVQWNAVNEQGASVPSGLYIYRIQAEMPSHTLVHSQKMLLVK